MRIHKVTIVASPDSSSSPVDMRGYSWSDSDPIEQLERAVIQIQEFIAEKKTEVAKPIEI